MPAAPSEPASSDSFTAASYPYAQWTPLTNNSSNNTCPVMVDLQFVLRLCFSRFSRRSRNKYCVLCSLCNLPDDGVGDTY